jgi:SAM-dependent methyltransferase
MLSLSPAKNHLEGIATFFNKAILEITGFSHPIKILDFGCGNGQLVKELKQYGYDLYGADLYLTNNDEHLKKIQIDPYKLPFDNNYFDIIISTSVLEHAINTEECFKEIYRILKPSGYAMHMFPGKWYLPTEPHIYVPFINWLWPYCPKLWLMLWAIVGRRNNFQKGKPWKQVYSENIKFCKQNLSYKSTKYYQTLSMSIFGNCFWPMIFYINNAPGGFSKFFKLLPFKKLTGILSREFRMSFLVMKK